MTQKEKQQLTVVIKERISETTSDIEELTELTKPISLDNSIGRLSRMDAINNKAINEKALRDKKKMLQQLEKTLERIDEKDFGICTKCGDEIPFGRLEYMPYTTRCVKCVG